jgi:hypothetical protein
MPGKSKRGKGKRPQNRNRARQPMTPSSASAGGTPAPAAAPAVIGTASAPARTPKGAAAKTLVYSGATTEQYPFFTSELKRIAVITGAILVVLIVLALVIR